ncbi:MAG: M24 family metallopeptidase [Solirubrobacteraceae bacterium]
MSSRAERLAADLRELQLDALLVTEPTNVRYLTGYTGSNGLALIVAEVDIPDRFYTDFRYGAQSAEQVPQAFEREITTSGDLLKAAAETLTGGNRSGRLGFEENHLTVKQHARLGELVEQDWEPVGCAGVVERLRAVKDQHEIELVRSSAQLTDEVLRWITEQGLAGRSEQEVAVSLEHQMRVLGAQAPSFPSIVASGEHGALPHAEPRNVEIPAGVLVTIDLGAILDGYCSDCTRTFATGDVPVEQREVYQLVLDAQIAGLEAVKPGSSGSEVDAVAREVIAEAGHSEHFGHGLGHGVGMEVHEGPRLSPTASDQPLQPGNVVTVEPGVYLPGAFGVRIEDLVLVTEQGCERLSRFPKELIVL